MCIIHTHDIIAKCQYDNEAFGINQFITTLNCKERCRCNVFNGTVTSKCMTLCQDIVGLKCEQHTKTIKQYLAYINGTLCTSKKS